MHKQISYAYASSTYAKRFKRAAQGCYVVEIKRHYTDARPHNVRGPFDTIEAAEAHALAIQADWSPFTMRAVALGVATDSKGREFLTYKGKAARSTVCGAMIHLETVCGSYAETVALSDYQRALNAARKAAA